MAVQVQRFVNKAKGYAYNPKSLANIDLTGLKIKATQNFTPKTKPEITPRDMELFRRYEVIKKLDMQISPKEINELFKYEGDEFFYKSYEFLCRKMGIPESIRPGIMEAMLPSEYGMAYAACNNAIIKNLVGSLKTKNEVFGAIRHELQHYMQNLSIYRHEELGPTAVKTYAEILSKRVIADVDQRAKNCTLEQIRAMGFQDDGIQIYEMLQKCLADNNPAEYEKMLDEIATGCKMGYEGELENLRQNIIKECGVIKKDSKAGNRAVKFFNEFIDELGFKHENGDIHYGKYLLRATENEAFIAQEAVIRKLEGKTGCYIHDVKHQTVPEIDVKLKEKMKQDLDEVKENLDPKETLRYLYD